MERFTTDNIAFFNELKIELADFKAIDDSTVDFIYIEITQLLYYAFSIAMRQSKLDLSHQFIVKIWDAKYDGHRFKLGIYNLDRIAIREQPLDISESKVAIIELLKTDLEVIKFEGIILDGHYCELNMPSKKQTLTWNINQEMNENLENLITLLRQLVEDIVIDRF
jgi:hypothetical protein